MNIIKEISLILRPNRENKHFEKRIKAIEEVLRDCYKWTEQEIEAKKSEFPNKYEKTVEKYVYWVNQFHESYEELCNEIERAQAIRTEEENLERILTSVVICLKAYPNQEKYKL